MDDDRPRRDQSAAEETATTEPTGQPPGAEGVGGDPLRPSERDEYATEATGDEESVVAGPSSPPWVTVALVLLAIFIAILLWAVLVGGNAAT